MSAPLSRRRFLGTAAAAGALGTAGTLLPSSVLEAMARPAPRGGLKAVKHVVILMQENRSFDHYFGTVPGVRGYGDSHPFRLRTDKSVMHQPNPTLPNPVLPFSLRDLATAQGKSSAAPQYLGSTPHSWPDAIAAANQGWWDNWIPAKTETTMAYLDERDLAFQQELARAFTLCDAYHCSLHGGTNPNRNYLWTGMTGFEPDGVRRAVENDAYQYDHAGYDWTTYPERLEQAGISWQIYQEWDNYTDNAVEYFKTFKNIGKQLLAKVTPSFRTTEEMYDRLGDEATPEPERARILKEFEAALAGLEPAQRSLFQRAMYRSAPGTHLDRFAADVRNGTLPQVVWLVPPSVDSEHPSISEPLAGSNYIYRLLDIIASSKETWDSTITLINFDENDGLFDHVPSPIPPRPATGTGTGPDWYDGHPIGLGPRVPMTVVSPWSVGGVISSEVFDHTSTLRLLELVTGVREPQISDWRRQVCGDLTGTLDFSGHRPPVRLTKPAPTPATEPRWNPEAPEHQSLPVQQEGRSPARALPYRPEVTLVPDGNSLRVELSNAGEAATHFAVYSYTGSPELPEHRDVTTGTSTVAVPAVEGRFDISVQGPNRFWVDATATVSGAAAGVRVGIRKEYRAKVQLELENSGSKAVSLELTARAYGSHRETVTLRPAQRRRIMWPTDRGWYDLTVTAAEDESWTRRLTGRTEDGKPGVTA